MTLCWCSSVFTWQCDNAVLVVFTLCWRCAGQCLPDNVTMTLCWQWCCAMTLCWSVFTWCNVTMTLCCQCLVWQWCCAGQCLPDNVTMTLCWCWSVFYLIMWQWRCAGLTMLVSVYTVTMIMWHAVLVSVYAVLVSVYLTMWQWRCAGQCLPMWQWRCAGQWLPDNVTMTLCWSVFTWQCDNKCDNDNNAVLVSVYLIMWQWRCAGQCLLDNVTMTLCWSVFTW